MSPFSSDLLLAALSQSDSEATASWKAWRGATDIQQAPWPELQFISMLNGTRLDEWLVDDPESGVIKGIVRRTWLEAQVRLALAKDATAILESAGCARSTLLGSAGSNLRALHLPAIRPISEIRLLIGRQDLGAADRALESHGWRRYGDFPKIEEMDWWTHLPYFGNGVPLYLHWRALNVAPDHAAACERQFRSGHGEIQAVGTSFRILSPGLALLEAVAPRSDSKGVDVIPWQAEAALITSSEIDWKQWTAMAARFCPTAIDRISELGALGVDFPLLPKPSSRLHWSRGLAGSARALRRRIGLWADRMRAAGGD